MNPKKNGLTQADWANQLRVRQAGNTEQNKPGLVQLKAASIPQLRKQPVAPPVYRPQARPKVLQTKSSSAQAAQASQATRQPLAPAVYRPAAKKVVQAKAISQERKTPTALPVYRPEQKSIAQPKSATAAPLLTRPNAPPVNSRYRLPVSPKPALRPKVGQGSRSTIQRSKAAVSSQSTKVILWFGQFEVHGSTGNLTGHAEMDAIDQFITACSNKDLDPVEEYNARKKKLLVQCEDKPVCVRCSCVLKALGFKPKNKNTEWGDETMDMTEWGVTGQVKDFLEAIAPGTLKQAKSY